MILARKPHTVGDRRRYIVDYSQWLSEGSTISAAAASTTSLTASVDGVTHDGTTMTFFVNGGELNGVFVVNLQMTDSLSEVKLDTIEFFCIAP